MMNKDDVYVYTNMRGDDYKVTIVKDNGKTFNVKLLNEDSTFLYVPNNMLRKLNEKKK